MKLEIKYAVYRMLTIDGKRTVREIIEELADHFQDEEYYESRVSTYLFQLQKDGFIKWIMNSDAK